MHLVPRKRKTSTILMAAILRGDRRSHKNEFSYSPPVCHDTIPYHPMIMMSDNCVWLSISGDHVKRMDEGLAIGLVRSGEDRSGSKLTTTQESPRTINAIFSKYRSWSVMTCLWVFVCIKI